MTCKDCRHRQWFGDYSLDYCGITRDQVTEDTECPINRAEKKQGGAKDE
jgi:hypothetical protein